MRQVISVSIGGGPCSKDCPFYTENGWVRGVNGIPLKTHCRGTMQDIIIDCDKFNSQTIEKLEVSDEQWQTMQHSVHKRAKKVRKEYPSDHAEIHPVGYNWKNAVNRALAAEKHQDKWNANKSANVH